ncbi:MAG: mannose-1-phosphate guanylyltransferase, partial [Marinirhabdus sp.]
RNTAPCILLAALKIYKQNPDGIMLVAPSDHWIEGTTAFKNDISLCFQTCAARDILMTLGIKPTFPNTGYGYIETETRTNNEIKKVLQFREKPDYGTAQQFVQNGNFLWNAGIFIWSAKSIIAAFKKSLPHMYALFHKGHSTWNTPSEKQFIASEYEKAQNISIDFGILEKAKNVFVKQATFSWNDLGTWRALHDKLPKDKAQNTVVRAKTQLRDATDNIIFTQKEKLVVVEGLHDYIIVEKDNVLLIFPKQKEQEIKKLVSEISGTFGTTYN